MTREKFLKELRSRLQIKFNNAIVEDYDKAVKLDRILTRIERRIYD